MKSEAGFTLIEILVTVTIIGILGAIAIMNTQGLTDGFKVRSGARQIYSDMQAARLNSIKQGSRWAICFSPGNTSFTSYSVRNTPGGDNVFCTTDDPTSGAAPFSIKNVTLSSGDYSSLSFVENFTGTLLEFSPTGTATAGTVTIAKGTRTMTVTVTSGTGNVKIQ